MRKPKRVIFPARAKKSIVELLFYYMEATGMSKRDTARMLGFKESHFHFILSGRNNPSLKLLRAMKKEMKIDGNLLLNLP